MIKTTIYLHRIGSRLFSRECDIITSFESDDMPNENYIKNIIENEFVLMMKKIGNNGFQTLNNVVEVRYFHYKDGLLIT